MRALLDTSVFLWAIDEPERLSKPARQTIENPRNELLLSAASLWEIILKAGKGKLLLRIKVSRLAAFLDEHVRTLGISILPIQRSHVLAVMALPQIHKDPFDRLLIAQSRVERATLISVDETIHAYGVDILW